MSGTSLYDEDVYAWSEQQAAALRRLAGRRDLPNELDLAHVAEEIEDVGISQLHAVRSRIQLILVHAIKCWADPDAASIRHWAAEIGTWHTDLLDRLTRSMRARVDMAQLWRRAVRQARLDLEARERDAARDQVVSRLADTPCPIALEQLCVETLEVSDLVQTIEAGAVPQSAPP